MYVSRKITSRESKIQAVQTCLIKAAVACTQCTVARLTLIKYWTQVSVRKNEKDYFQTEVAYYPHCFMRVVWESAQ